MPTSYVQLPNLIGGVSQLPDAQRDTTQVTSMVNGWATPQDGLRKRPPTKHLVDATNYAVAGQDSDRLLHPIDRSGSERYFVDLSQDAIQVFDAATGTSFVVADQAGNTFNVDYSYLDVRRYGLIQNPEAFTGAAGWTTNNLSAAASLLPPPLDKGAAVSLFTTTGAGGTATATHTAAPATGAIGTTYGTRVYVNQPSQGQALSDFQLLMLFAGSSAIANFSWVGTTPILGITSWSGTDYGTIVAGAVDVGGGWFEIVLLVRATDTVTAAVSSLQMPAAATAVRGLDAFGMQHFRSDSVDDNPVPLDITAFPSYHVKPVHSALSVATFADTTYVANEVRSPALTSDLTADTPTFPLYDDVAMVFVKTAGYDQRFELTVKTDAMPSKVTLTVWTVVLRDNTGEAIFPTAGYDPTDPNQVVVNIRTQNVADGFRVLLSTLPNFTALRRGSVVGITIAPGMGDFEILEAVDSLGDTALVSILDSVEAFEDLPTLALDDYKVRVRGSDADATDDYWVKFVQSGRIPGGVFQNGEPRPGEWEETVAPGIQHEFDGDTMPHQLVRRFDQDGTVTGTTGAIYFEWGPATWDDRLVGDDLTNRATRLLGRGVADIGFYRSRLYLVADRVVLFSEINEPTNLWRTTVRSLLDGDRIEVEVPDANVSRLHTAVPMDRNLLVLSDSAVYLVGGEPLLTPSTVATSTALRLQTAPDAPVVRLGDRLVAFSEQGAFTLAHEISVPPDDRITATSNDLTGAVQRYVPGEVYAAVARPETGVMLIVPTSDQSRVFAYQETITGGDRIQASWWTHELPASAKVVGLAQLDRTTGLLVLREGRLSLETVTFLPSLEDPGLGYEVAVDRRVTEAATGAVYDPGSDTTAITVPYLLTDGGVTSGPGTPQVVTRDTGSSDGGRRLYVVSATGSVVTVRGDHTATALYVGEQYDLIVELSRPHPVKITRGGRRTPLGRGSRRAEWISLEVADTAHFDLVVKAPLRPEARLAWRTPLGQSQIGPAQLVTDRVRVRVGLPVEEAVVTLENSSPFPSRFVAGEWTLNVERYA